MSLKIFIQEVGQGTPVQPIGEGQAASFLDQIVSAISTPLGAAIIVLAIIIIAYIAYKLHSQ